jgi:ABC-type multidrug transport system fused ATPase/permease subunit
MPEQIYGNLANQFPDSTLLTGQTDLKSSINTLNTNLNNINDKTASFLGNQEQVLNIIDQEKNRLNEKKQSIDNAYSSQVRSTQLNQSMNKRYQGYLKIMYVFIICLVISLILAFASNSLVFIPSFIFTFIYIGLFSFAVIYSISIYMEIQKHERIVYDRLDMGRIKVDASNSTSDISNNKDQSGNVVGNCAEINPVTGNCIRLLETFCGNNEWSTLNSYEFTNYSQY